MVALKGQRAFLVCPGRAPLGDFFERDFIYGADPHIVQQGQCGRTAATCRKHWLS